MVLTHQIAMSSEAPRGTRRVPLVVAAVLSALLVGLFGYIAGGGFAPHPGSQVADSVARAWKSGDQSAVSTLYAPHAELLVDGSLAATGPEAIGRTIRADLAAGDSVRSLGAVTTYGIPGGDRYVSGLVEVSGPDHPGGDVYELLLQVRDGLVVRQTLTPSEPSP